MKSESEYSTGVETSVMRDSALVPTFKWNGLNYGEITLSRMFQLIDNPQLGKSTRQYDWATLSGVNNVVHEISTILPQIVIPEGLIGIRISLTNNHYHGRLQLNHVIESLSYTLGHFRPYKANYVVVLVREDVSFLQVIEDFEDEVVLIDKEPIPTDEMIKLTSDPHAWLRASDTFILPV